MKSWIRLTICILLLMQTGCWSKVEVDEQIFVLALYIDKGEKPGTVEVTISSPLPNRMMSGQQAGSGGGGKPYAMVSNTDLTLSDTIRTIQRDLTRRLNFGHTREIVVGREYAEEGIGELLDWIDKEPSFHISTFLTTAEGRAREIAGLLPLYEQMPAEVLRKMTMQHTLFTTKVKECLISYYSKVGFATNYMSISVKRMPSENERPEKWGGIHGAALYQGDKMKGSLPAEEARVLAWATGRLGKQVFTVTWDDGQSYASVMLKDMEAVRRVRMTKQGPQFSIKLKADGSIVNQKDAKRRNDTELSRLVTDLLNKKVVHELESALDMTKESEADVLKLGLLLEWKYPAYWKGVRDNWPKEYKHSRPVRIKAQVDLTNITNQP
ncbi:Ger(x)C family spore germination protein [Paenibacillus sp. SAF-054]|uniref:Ger(x)C family spore germination protein n=1 Tax=unclassified Paenibacillus TaxID=185978 RepID=UPI003F7FF337